MNVYFRHRFDEEYGTLRSTVDSTEATDMDEFGRIILC